ncbi:MAG: hypothetical protein HFJ45_02635 [Clostridia bacterium]|nr:hypothetical protein [Clostridia bacterium]
MIYNGNLVKIDGNVIPHIQQYKIGRAKLWKEADRVMSGDIKATLIGIFPKIQIKIGVTTQTEMAELVTLFDKDFFEVEWFDVRIQTTIKTNYYASDYDIELLSKRRGLYQPFEVNLVPVSKRRY